MDFKNIGYKSGKIFFPGLNLTIDIGKDKYFRNDGYILDLDVHTDEVFKEIGRKNDYKRHSKSYGRHVGFFFEREIKASTIFLKNTTYPGNIFNWGHESTHVLEHLGQEQHLLDDLKSEGFNLNPFTTYSDVESRAHIGGLLALHKKNLIHKVSNPEFFGIIDDLMISKWED